MLSRSGMRWIRPKLARRVLSALLILLIGGSAVRAQEAVTLQLPGMASFRFAGYYAALDQGLYAAEGLDVTIVEGTVESPIEAVLSGQAHFGVSASELVQARLEGKSVVALATIFQESAYCFLSSADSLISTPADLSFKKVILAAESGDVELRAFLRSAGVALRDITLVSPTFADAHITALTAGDVDVIRACTTYEPVKLRLDRKPFSILRPSSKDVDFYGDALFTSQAWVRDDRRRVDAFRRASLKGWRFALDNREAVFDDLLTRHIASKRGITREHLRLEASEVRDLILPDLVPIGQMNPERWASTAEMLWGLGLAPEAPAALDGFVFDPDKSQQRPALVRWLTLGLAGALSAIAIFMMWSLQLRQAVARRTREYKESMRRLLEAQAIGHVGDWELDLATGHIAWSDEMFRLFEVDPARGVPPFEKIMSYFSQEDQALIRRNMKKAVDEGVEVRTNTRPRIASGKLRYLSGIMTPVRDDSGKVVKLIGVTQDITQSKVQEAGLVSSEARYRTLVDHAPDAIVTMDMATGRFVEANPRACELYGLSREVLLTKSPVDLSPPLQPDGRPSAESAMERINQAIRGEAPVFRWDHLRSDGTIVPCEVRLIRLPSEGGPLVRGSLTDISERLHAEEALNRRTADLERSNRELERFAYVASHDLQEPLRMVTSFTQLLAQRYGAKLGPDADEFIEFAVDGAKRMQLLIDDLLAYSRAGRRDVKLTKLQADRALDDALANLKGTIELSGAIVTREALPTITADLTQFVQLFQNLVSNAVKFRADDPPRIHISARRDNGEWVFAVKDNGIGIDPSHQGKLFVMFQRLHPRHRYPGTGIGLALCKLIVERHGGRIWVESTPGEGSTFGFTVPAPQEEPT